jgi:hypothetical protein
MPSCNLVLAFLSWPDTCSSPSSLTVNCKLPATSESMLCELQVLGNVKGVVATVISVFCFLNAVSFLGCCGYAVTVIGSILYSESKRACSRHDALVEGGHLAITSSPTRPGKPREE